MELVVIGSGCGVPSLSRGAPAMLLRIGGEEWLIDCGISVLTGLLKAGTSVTQVDRILITHFHPDHTAGLVPFLFACKYHDAPRTKELNLLGPIGLRSFYDRLRVPYGDWLTPERFEIHFTELAHGDEISLPIALILPRPCSQTPPGSTKERCDDTATVSSFRAEHAPPSIGYRIKSPERNTFVVSGDTDICEELIEYSRNADLLVLECSFPDGHGLMGHLTPEKVARIATLARPQRLLLSHFYPICDSHDIASEIARGYPGEVIVARDGMSLCI